MNLIKWEDNKIVITPEAYAIKVFRDIWKADKQRNKENAIMELGLLYFMYDPRSEYQFEIDEASRLAAIKKQTGINSKWQPNDRFKAAVEVYVYLTQTTSALILEGNRKTAETIRQILETPLEEIDQTKRIEHAEKMARTAMVMNKLAIDIATTEKEVYKDVEEQSVKLRGKESYTLGDIGAGGVDELFKGIM